MAENTPTLTEFLLARITEDEVAAREAAHSVMRGEFGRMSVPIHLQPFLSTQTSARVFAECEAKRRIVRMHFGEALYCYGDRPEGTLACDECGDTVTVAWPCPTLRAIALPYADHPDCRQEWVR